MIEGMMTLKEHRRAAFLTTRELAEKADVSPDTVWRIEGGRGGELQVKTMRKIAKALGVHPSEITEFAPSSPTAPTPPNTSYPTTEGRAPQVIHDPPESTESAASVLARKMAEKPLGGNGE